MLFFGMNSYSKPAFSIGSIGMEYGKASCVDSKDNVIIAALYQNTINLDPNGDFPLTSAGGVDGVIAKYNKKGEFIWGKGFGGANQSTDVPHGVTVDKDDNIYFCGYFGTAGQTGKTCDFDPSSATNILTSFGGFDAFIAKWNKDGEFIWVRQIANLHDTTEDRAWDLSLDNDGNAYVTGAFKGTMNLGNGISLSAKGNGFNIFLIKYSTSGNVLWAKSVGANISNLFTEGYGTVDVDSEGNLIWLGNFRETCDLNPNGGNSVTSSGQTDIFMIKLNATNGNFIWGYKVGGTQADIVSPGAMRIDANDNFTFTGRFAGTSNFNPKGTNNISGGSMYLASYSKNCDYRFAFAMTSSTPGSGGHRVDYDKNNNILVAGWMRGTTDFNPNGTNNLSSKGTQDIFLAKYDNNGNYIWANNFGAVGNTGSDICAGLAIDSEGSSWLTGQFYGTNADYDPSDSDVLLSTLGQNDCFVLKYDKDGNLWDETTPPIKYLLTVKNGSGSGEYKTGEKVTIKANPAPDGYKFDKWSGDIEYIESKLSEETTATMPAKDIEITANYIIISSVDDNKVNSSIVIFPNPASDYIEINFERWSPSARWTPSLTGEISIYNTLGEYIVTVGARHALPLQRIDVSHLPVGVYFIQIGNYREKFMVVR